LERKLQANQHCWPGRLAASDFTVCNELGVKIAGQRFEHTFFHCVLTYSNVESVSLCFSESFESLSAGIQKAFWEFGGVPERHRSDSLAAAVRNHTSRRELTERYAALMSYYNCEADAPMLAVPTKTATSNRPTAISRIVSNRRCYYVAVGVSTAVKNTLTLWKTW